MWTGTTFDENNGPQWHHQQYQQQLNHTPYPSQAYTHHEYHDPSLYQQQQWAYNHQQVLEEESADYMDLDDELFQEELRRELQELRQESGNTLNVEWEEKRKEGGAYDPAVTAMEIINHAEQQDTVFDAVIVVDTNYLISHLRFISQLSQVLDASMPLMIPTIVIRELDGLKSRRKPADNAPAETLGEQARKAIDFLYRSLLSKKPSIRGQRLEDRLPDLDVLKMSNDDRILECCRFSKKFQAIRVYLLSNDKNLCVNAMFHGIDTISNYKDSPESLVDRIHIDLEETRLSSNVSSTNHSRATSGFELGADINDVLYAALTGPVTFQESSTAVMDMDGDFNNPPLSVADYDSTGAFGWETQFRNTATHRPIPDRKGDKPFAWEINDRGSQSRGSNHSRKNSSSYANSIDPPRKTTLSQTNSSENASRTGSIPYINTHNTSQRRDSLSDTPLFQSGPSPMATTPTTPTAPINLKTLDPNQRIVIELLDIFILSLQPTLTVLLARANLPATLLTAPANKSQEEQFLDIIQTHFPVAADLPAMKGFMKDMVRFRDRGGKGSVMRGDLGRFLEGMEKVWGVCSGAGFKGDGERALRMLGEWRKRLA